MTNVRKLLEMAMDFGDAPDAVHPAHKQALAGGQHGLGKIPAISSQSAERHASETYRNIIGKLRAFGGVVPRSPRDVQRTAMDMFQTLQTIQQREAAHRPQLEQLAIETVLRMPEFKSLRQAIQSGTVRIEPHLDERIEITDVAFSDEPQEELPDENVPEIAAEYQDMVNRRKLTNTMIHGAAVANNYAFTNSFDELMDIDRTLARDYGKLMAYSELGFFVHDPAIMKAAAEATGSESQGGQNQLRRDEDGSLVITAQGITFPILVQEIVKGCMEFLSLGDEDDPDTAHKVRQRSDFVDDEQVQMQVGPSIYRSFIAAIGEQNADLMPYVYDHLNRLPTQEYNQVVKGLIDGTPEGKNWFQQLAREIRQRLTTDEQSESLTRRLLGN